MRKTKHIFLNKKFYVTFTSSGGVVSTGRKHSNDMIGSLTSTKTIEDSNKSKNKEKRTNY